MVTSAVTTVLDGVALRAEDSDWAALVESLSCVVSILGGRRHWEQDSKWKHTFCSPLDFSGSEPVGDYFSLG